MSDVQFPDDASDPTSRSPLTALARAPGYLRKRVRRWVASRRVARELDRRPDHPATDRERAVATLAGADRVLFLCWGNVCRSPMAARYCESRLAERGVEGVTVASAGLGEREGRPSPPDAVTAAAEYDVNLRDHRSRRLRPGLVGASDAVFVMDFNDFHDVRTRHPDVLDETFFLRTFAGDGPTIPDPHGEGPGTFERTYATVATAVEGVVEALDGHPPGGDGGECGDRGER